MPTMLPTHLLLLALVVMVTLHVVAPLRSVVPYPGRLLGVTPLLLGVAMNLVADRAFKKARTTVKPFEESSALLTTGMFALSRNPMYLGFLFILVGVGVIMGSLAPFGVAVVFPLLVQRMFIRREEEQLREIFGEAWSRYRSRVRRWL